MALLGLLLLLSLLLAGLFGRRPGDRAPNVAMARLESALSQARRRGQRVLLYLRDPGAPSAARLDAVLGGPLRWRDRAAAAALRGFVVHTRIVHNRDDAAAAFLLGAIGWARPLDELPALFELEPTGRWVRRADLAELLETPGDRALLEWLSEPAPDRPTAKA